MNLYEHKKSLKYVFHCTRLFFSPQRFFFPHHFAPGHLNHHFYSCHDERLWTSYSSASAQMRANSNPERITDLYAICKFYVLWFFKIGYLFRSTFAGYTMFRWKWICKWVLNWSSSSRCKTIWDRSRD